MKVRVIKSIKEVGFSGAPRAPEREPRTQDTRTHRVMPLKVGRPIKRKPVKLEEQEDEPTKEFLASLQELIEPFINSDITNPRRP
jgi:hypothetical protein